jgi:hypothetical protein
MQMEHLAAIHLLIQQLQQVEDVLDEVGAQLQTMVQMEDRAEAAEQIMLGLNLLEELQQLVKVLMVEPAATTHL